MLEIQSDDIKKMQLALERVASAALPYAERSALNSAAFYTQRAARERIREDFINRSRFTERSVRVAQARRPGSPAIVGSIADYMETQEFGGTKTARGDGLVIPTAYSAGETGKRTRLPRPANRFKRIKLAKTRGRVAKTRAQSVIFAVQDAVTTGKRTVFLDLKKRRGIYKVVGGRKSFKRGWPKGASIRLLHDLSRRRVSIGSRPWLAPAVAEANARMPEFYFEALKFQLRRLGYTV